MVKYNFPAMFMKSTNEQNKSNGHRMKPCKLTLDVYQYILPYQSNPSFGCGTWPFFWGVGIGEQITLLRVIPTMTFQNSHVRFYVSLIVSGEGRHTTHLLKCVWLLSTSQTDWKQSSDILSDISFDILSDISSDILSDISFDILSDISSDISSDMSSDILSDISFDILSDVSSDILSGISFGILSDISFDILSNISSDISSDILSDISFDILSDISSDRSFDIVSDISFDILSDISSDSLSDILLSDHFAVEVRHATMASHDRG